MERKRGSAVKRICMGFVPYNAYIHSLNQNLFLTSNIGAFRSNHDISCDTKYVNYFNFKILFLLLMFLILATEVLFLKGWSNCLLDDG